MDTNGVSVPDFMFGLKSLAAADLIPVKTNNGTFATVGNGEGIAPVTQDLFRAAATDQMSSFLLSHPELAIDGMSAAK